MISWRKKKQNNTRNNQKNYKKMQSRMWKIKRNKERDRQITSASVALSFYCSSNCCCCFFPTRCSSGKCNFEKFLASLFFDARSFSLFLSYTRVLHCDWTYPVKVNNKEFPLETIFNWFSYLIKLFATIELTSTKCAYKKEDGSKNQCVPTVTLEGWYADAGSETPWAAI